MELNQRHRFYLRPMMIISSGKLLMRMHDITNLLTRSEQAHMQAGVIIGT